MSVITTNPETVRTTPETGLRGSLRRNAVFAYGTASYALFVATLLYAVGFVGNLAVPRSIDIGPSTSLPLAMLVNLFLLGLFAVQHTGMARQGFKRWITRYIPASAERSTYVLATNLAFLALFIGWRPIPGVIWSVENAVGRGLLLGGFWAGWALVLVATFMINHFDLFGMRQVWRCWRGLPADELAFRAPGLYRRMRHPIQAGFLLAFWSTPVMTAGHFLFAGVTTAYIVVALKVFEERDLVREFGPLYRRYREQVGMFLPLRKYHGPG